MSSHSKDILSQYGRNTPQPQAPKATSGGPTTAKPLPYSPPKGPTGQMRQGPGLGGANHGNNPSKN